MTRLRVGAGAVVLTAAPMAFLASPASAGGGTGITATPVHTLAFNGGSAKFVRAASGIINETNRVGQGDQVAVWFQFRPTTGPSGSGSPTPNPACDRTNLVAQFLWHNTDPLLGGTTSGGYFIGANTYNVCEYYVYNTFALTLLANGSTPGVAYNGQDVTYSGVETNGPNAVVGDPVTLTWWNGYNCVNPAAGSVGPYLTDLTGTYTHDAGLAGVGTFSIRASTQYAVSTCLNLTELPNQAGTLLADGLTALTVPTGVMITYTGTFTYNGVGVNGLPVTMSIYTSPGCTGALYSGSAISTGVTTDGSGNFQWGPDANTLTVPTGNFYLQASSAGGYLSNCINVDVGTTTAVNDVTTSPSTTWACATGATGGTATSSTVFWFRNQVTSDITVQITVTGALANSTFDVWVEQNPGTCPPGTSSSSNSAALTTDGSGNGTVSFSFTPVVGATNFWLSMWTPSGSLTGTQVLRSVAATI